MISPTTARQRSIQLPHRLYHDLIEFLCAWYTSFRDFGEEHGACEEGLKMPCQGLILTKPRSGVIAVSYTHLTLPTKA